MLIGLPLERVGPPQSEAPTGQRTASAGRNVKSTMRDFIEAEIDKRLTDEEIVLVGRQEFRRRIILVLLRRSGERQIIISQKELDDVSRLGLVTDWDKKSQTATIEWKEEQGK